MEYGGPPMTQTFWRIATRSVSQSARALGRTMLADVRTDKKRRFMDSK